MIIDLSTHDRNTSISTQILIIGAGIAGLLLAAKLRERYVPVVVLESGARDQNEEIHPLNQVVLTGDRYRGALHGRFRCLGGTSTRWGGALIPFLPDDFAARPYLGVPPWPVSPDDLYKYMVDIENLFGIEHGSYEQEFTKTIGANPYVPVGDGDFRVRFAKWPSFKHRNIATLLKDKIERDSDLVIWINATATTFELDEERRVRSVTARHRNGRTLKVAASQFVVCAGAIETTRLLLLLDWQHGGRVFKECGALGHFFHDHISARMATINAKRVRDLNRMAGLRFTANTMRSLRYELSPSAQAEDRVPSAFAHISFRAEKASGFDSLRECLRTLQRDGRMDLRLCMALLRDMPYLSKSALWRYAYNQLYWPRPAKYELHVAAEQRPWHCNYISLASEVDAFGMPLAAINWRVRSEDCTVFSAFLRRFETFWKRNNLGTIGDLRWLEGNDVSVAQISDNLDIFHPGGSTRMGTEGRSAVVDKDLRAFAIPNLWISSTSAFPSGASANPTLMLMLFTARLADHLAPV